MNFKGELTKLGFNEMDRMQGTGSATALTVKSEAKGKKINKLEAYSDHFMLMTVNEIVKAAMSSLHLQMRGRYVIDANPP